MAPWQSAGKPANNGQSLAKYTVSSESQSSDVEVQTLCGDYADKGANHGKRYYQKIQAIKGHEDIKVFLYYWDERDGDDFSGWWFGDSVGGTEVWARCEDKGPLPPRIGWKVPWDSPTAMPGILTVSPTGASAASSPATSVNSAATSTASKKTASMQKIELAEKAAGAVVVRTKTALNAEKPRAEAYMKDLESKLKQQQTALSMLQKSLDGAAPEESAKVSTILETVEEQLQQVQAKLGTPAGPQVQSSKPADAPQAVAKAELDKSREEKDNKDLEENLPAAREASLAAEEAIEGLMALADPIVASPPPDDSDDLKYALDEVEAMVQDVQARITDARKVVESKLKSARAYAPETRKAALTEFAKLQATLGETQKKLMPYKSFKKDFKAKVAAKKTLVEFTEKLSSAELEVEKAEMMSLVSEGEQKPEEEITATEKAIEPAHNQIAALLRSIEQKMRSAEAAVKDELLQIKDKVASLQKKCDAVKKEMRSQRMGLSAKEMASKVTEKVVAVEDALAACHAAEMPFLKGIEVLPGDESEKAISSCEAAATKAEAALNHAKILIKAKQVEAQKFPKELQEKAKAELAEFQKRTEDFGKKVQDFRKETTDRKIESIMADVVVALNTAEEKVKAHTEVAKIFSADIEKVSTEELQEAMEKVTDLDKEATASLNEARKQMAAKQRDMRRGPVASSLNKLQDRFNECQAELTKHRKAANNAPKLIKGKEILAEERRSIEAMESEIVKAEKAVRPLELGGELTEDEMAEAGDAMVAAQSALKSGTKSLDAHLSVAVPTLKTALLKLLEQCKAGQEKLDKTLDGSKSKREEVLGSAYLRDARKKTDFVEACLAKVDDAELPFMKGVEVLPAEEATPAVAASEKAAEELSSSISEARNFMAAKNLELKSFSDKEKSKSLSNEFAQLSTRVNAASTKLASFKKETDTRKKTAQLQEAGEKVTALEQDVAKIAEIVAPFTGEDAASIPAEESDTICEQAGAQAKEAQTGIDECRQFLAARRRDALPNSAETLKQLSSRLAEASASLAKTKRSFQEQEHKFLGKRVVKEAEALVAGLGAALTAAEEACATLLVKGGEEFLVTTSLRTLAGALREYMDKESKDMSTVFKEASNGEPTISQDVFVAYLQQLPEKIAHPEIEFTEERRTALFTMVDNDGGGAIDESKFKEMFKLQFLCVQTVSMTDALQVSSSKTVCKVEPDEILEALGAITKDEKGVERVETKVLSSGKSGFVTIKGNQGSTYLQAIHPFDEYCTGMDKAVEESVQSVKKVTSTLNAKSNELQSAGKSQSLTDARAELAKLRPKAVDHLTTLQELKQKVANAKKDFLKTEAAEKNAHIERKEQREADAITSEVTEELAAAEALAKQAEEAAEPLLALKGEELQNFVTPASVKDKVAELVPEAVAALSKVKAAAQEKRDALAKAVKGPMLEAKRKMIKIITNVEAATKKCNANLDTVKTACDSITENALAKASSALRDMLRSSGSGADELFSELAKGENLIQETAFCSKITSLPGLSLEPEHAKLIFNKIEDGGISKRSLVSVAQKYYAVVTSIAITPEFDVGKGRMLRKAEPEELIEVLEGPQTDEKTKLMRVKGRSLLDSQEGWISIKGNQGSVFLKEVQKPSYTVTSDQEVPMESQCKASGDVVRPLKPGEVLEMLSGPRKETFEPSLWARGKLASEDAMGWFSIRDKEGIVYAEPDNKLYTCTAAIAMTDELDIKKCDVLKKLAVGDTITVEEGPIEVKESGVTRLKGKTTSDDKVGWITVKGSAGTVYAQPSKKHYTVVKELELHKAMSLGSETVRQLAEGDAIQILEGPKEEVYEPVKRVQVKASSDGAIGWVTVGATSVKRWYGVYKCSAAQPLHSASKLEGADALRDIAVGEQLEFHDGPVNEAGELRVKVKAKKDGSMGWATLIDSDGKRMLSC